MIPSGRRPSFEATSSAPPPSAQRSSSATARPPPSRRFCRAISSARTPRERWTWGVGTRLRRSSQYHRRHRRRHGSGRGQRDRGQRRGVSARPTGRRCTIRGNSIHSNGRSPYCAIGHLLENPVPPPSMCPPCPTIPRTPTAGRMRARTFPSSPPPCRPSPTEARRRSRGRSTARGTRSSRSTSIRIRRACTGRVVRGGQDLPGLGPGHDRRQWGRIDQRGPARHARSRREGDRHGDRPRRQHLGVLAADGFSLGPGRGRPRRRHRDASSTGSTSFPARP